MKRKSMTIAVLSALALSAAYAAPTLANDTHSGAASGTRAQSHIGSSASAQNGHVGAAMNEMVKADVNKDGKVTRDEIQKLDPSLARNFDQADANHDGMLSLREFETLRGGTSVGGTSGSSVSGSTSGGTRSGSHY